MIVGTKHDRQGSQSAALFSKQVGEQLFQNGYTL
jgi:hypothetical protein